MLEMSVQRSAILCHGSLKDVIVLSRDMFRRLLLVALSRRAEVAAAGWLYLRETFQSHAHGMMALRGSRQSRSHSLGQSAIGLAVG